MPAVVFLRGVNVGGHRTFRPADLARELDALEVVSIGAAGTFVVHRPATQAGLRAEFAKRLPFATEIMICDARDLLAVHARDWFSPYPARPDVVRFVTVLARRPRQPLRAPLDIPAGGRWLVKVVGVDGRLVVGMYRREMQAVRHLGSFDRLFGVPATTRNWNTLGAIVRELGGVSRRPARP